METQTKENKLEIIRSTPALQLANLDLVKERYIKNYNLCNGSNNGELMYHRNSLFFNQILNDSDKLKKADPFSLYACLITIAVNGYSLDPKDDEVYLVPRDGKAYLDIQAGALVQKRKRAEQIDYVEPAKLVKRGDVFEVENGRVVRHIQKFMSDDIIAGYVKVILERGKDIFFIYEKSDWESWRKKSPNPKTIEKIGQYGKYLSESLWDNGELNGKQPEPNFLKTKIVKHAMREKCWATGNRAIVTEIFTDVEIETDEPVRKKELTSTTIPDDESFASDTTINEPETITHSEVDDNF